MTAFLAGLTVGALGVAYTHVCWWRAWHRWADQHAYRRVRLAATRVKQVCEEADHERRLRLRVEAQTAELRDGVGELLDTVAEKDRTIASLRRYRLDYGIHRRRVLA